VSKIRIFDGTSSPYDLLVIAASQFRPALSAALDSALAHLEALDDASVGATVDAATLRDRLFRPLKAEPTDPLTVIEDLVCDVKGGLLGMPGGRFYAWVIGGSLPAALAADWLTSAWDQNAALYMCGPAAAIVEEVVGAWIKELLGLPEPASFALTTGCQMAHVTALAAARHAVLARRGWNIEESGLYGAPPIRLIASNTRHAAFDRAIRLLGFGDRHAEYIEPAADETIEPRTLRSLLETQSNRPTIVLLQAGDINAGAFDNFNSLVPIAHEFGAWVHVDGAFGLWAGASPTYRHMIDGVAAADSWAMDGHKWLNVPFDCGYAFVADAESHRAAMSVRAPYITAHAEARDEIDWNPEWSRRARGFASYAALRQLGRNGLADLIDRTCLYARKLVDGIGKLEGVDILWQPTLNQGLVRFLAGGTDPGAADHDARTEDVIARVVESGQAFFGATVWRGVRAMRVSVLNWQTSDEDVARAVRAVADALS
jgi:glutamate/tyrosine decarboxylase-like PLP-dependent enzyme